MVISGFWGSLKRRRQLLCGVACVLFRTSGELDQSACVGGYVGLFCVVMRIDTSPLSSAAAAE